MELKTKSSSSPSSLPIRWLILQCGRTGAWTKSRFGTNDEWFKSFLHDDKDTWKVKPVCIGDFPTEKELEETDVLLLTGSVYSAHDRQPWMIQLEKLCFDYVFKYPDKKIVGICFGHQSLALAFGGLSGRAKCGREIGVKKLGLTPSFQKMASQLGLPLILQIYQTHQDQVSELPPKARLLASSTYCPIEMFHIGTQVLAMQGHPEMYKDYLIELIEGRVKEGTIDIINATKAYEEIRTLVPDQFAFRILIRSFVESSPSIFEEETLITETKIGSKCSEDSFHKETRDLQTEVGLPQERSVRVEKREEHSGGKSDER